MSIVYDTCYVFLMPLTGQLSRSGACYRPHKKARLKVLNQTWISLINQAGLKRFHKGQFQFTQSYLFKSHLRSQDNCACTQFFYSPRGKTWIIQFTTANAMHTATWLLPERTFPLNRTMAAPSSTASIKVKWHAMIDVVNDIIRRLRTFLDLRC